MKSNIFKKIITVIYLTIFLFGFFIPLGQTFAQDPNDLLKIVADPSAVRPNEYTTIYAKMTPLEIMKVEEEIRFYSWPQVEGFHSVAKCKITEDSKWACAVKFKSSTEGSFEINASTTVLDGSATFQSNKTPVKVDKNAVAITNQENTTDTNTTYTPLAPLPGLGDTIQTDPGCEVDKDGNVIPGSCTNPCPFGNYLNIIIKLIIGIAAVLAMVMIVMGGIEYMTSDFISSKEAGKDTIRNAILGLLIALGAYLILNTINPQLLSVCLDKLPKAVITILPYDANINSYTTKTSGNCRVLTSGDCSVENLKSVFGDKANSASMICSVESGGIADKKSGSDYCSIGKTTFSFGLFQINLLVHGDKIPSSVGNCKDLFTTSKGEEIGYGKKGYVVRDEKGNYSYDCKLKSDRGDDYNKCSAYLKTASGNLFVASKLFKARVFEDWRPSDQKVCPAAFQ